MRVYLDTETTGLSAKSGDEIVEIAIIAEDGQVLINSLVNPKRPIPLSASNIHGITDAMVASSPTLEVLWSDIRDAIGGNEVIIYNARYDTEFFPNKLSNASRVRCAMLEYASRMGSRRWFKLSDAAEHVGHVWLGEAHRALADAQACRSVWDWLYPSPKKKMSKVSKGIPLDTTVSKKSTVRNPTKIFVPRMPHVEQEPLNSDAGEILPNPSKMLKVIEALDIPEVGDSENGEECPVCGEFEVYDETTSKRCRACGAFFSI